MTYASRLFLTTVLAAGVLAVAACSKSESPAVPAPAAQGEAPKPPLEPVPNSAAKLVMPDACAMLDAAEVATAAGWKSANAVKVNTGAEYLSACDYVDGADAKRKVRVGIAYGALIPDDSASYAAGVGDREGTLKQPALPVTTFGDPTIEMDGGPGAQSMQTRFEPTTELTVTAPTMQVARALFPRALIKLRKLQKP